MDDDAGDEESDYYFYGEGDADLDGSSDISVAESVQNLPPPLKDRVLLLLDGSEDGEDLDRVQLCQSVWSCLPEDLLNKVLVWLPVQSICRMRLVCKLWKAVLSDEKLLEENASHLATAPGFLKFVEQFERRPGDPGTLVASKWSLLPLDFVPGYRFSSVACARGLLCCMLDAFQGPTAPAILVVNPFTRTWIVLPDPPNSVFQAAMSMVYAEDRKSYVIVVVNHRVYNPLLETCEVVSSLDYDSADSDSDILHYVITADIYDSAENSWRTSTQVYQARVEGGHAFCNGSIYWLATQHEPGTGLNYVISYTFSEDSWSCFGIPQLTLVREFPEAEVPMSVSCNLVGMQGGVFLVAEVEGPHGTSISIWKHQDNMWQQVDSISSDIYTALLGYPTDRGVFNFVGSNDVIWINLYGSVAALAYDFRSKSLRRLPDCPFHVEERAAEKAALDRIYRMPSLYGFQPRLDSVEKAFANP